MKIVTQVFWLILIGPIAAQGADWPWFGGPNRDGVASEKEIVLDWGDREPARLWKAKIGAGYSSIVVGGGNLFRGVQGTASGMDRTSADYMGMMAND